MPCICRTYQNVPNYYKRPGPTRGVVLRAGQVINKPISNATGNKRPRLLIFPAQNWIIFFFVFVWGMKQ